MSDVLVPLWKAVLSNISRNPSEDDDLLFSRPEVDWKTSKNSETEAMIDLTSGVVKCITESRIFRDRESLFGNVVQINGKCGEMVVSLIEKLDVFLVKGVQPLFRCERWSVALLCQRPA